ncbi:hypothetical protein V6Z11_A07G224900, partial [Gossypium hirsutum]
LSRVGLGQNPKVWEEPGKFKPERHLQHRNKGKEASGCPGVVLGNSMTTMFARLLQGFDWSIPANLASIDLSQEKGE